MKELAELNAIYQKMSTPDVDEAMIVTNADKKGNTPAYQGYKAGKKNVKTGEPLYKKADHMKEAEDFRNIANINVKSKDYTNEKDLISKIIGSEVIEATRYKKEMGYNQGGTKKPTSPKVSDPALDAVKAKYKGQIMRSGSNQPKKVKGQKTDGEGKYLKQHKANQKLKSDAKEMGYGSDTKGYVETRARYGSKENMKSGRGLGT